MSDFVFVSGRSCLDLAGTKLWRRSAHTELLDSPDALRQWIAEAELVDDPGHLDGHDLDRVRRLRESVYGLVWAWLPGQEAATGTEEDLARVNDAARLPLPKLQMNAQGALTRLGGVDEVLGAVARDAIDLLSSRHIRRTKECAGSDCTRLFVDLSRSGARRWCGMAECGNKRKAADYRQRKKQQTSKTSGSGG
ncbi:CGNR zinc finger domain-containing protein [Streptomyces marispadix]|uniref:ABATE domain-containing protein n=1 Tax=Streptomyces marispadix TaxID=2922868 RepID=A0ABS9T255_9ACTN|nr:CGNR zinc finger domain-containing protein [Streptomyces marispadix]MCH6162588.1 ABATE domain-containing protein [Streptomyces marispadix]